MKLNNLGFNGSIKKFEWFELPIGVEKKLKVDAKVLNHDFSKT